ncbi:DUF2752 domain-containing protein [Myceligenerans crystallogenes]|uniref:DUF2752 domain-containing protein n=1 Tax=Myceligenerans crystallogenes TaxID=316335 RepID=A0ABN2NAM3_9MICO
MPEAVTGPGAAATAAPAPLLARLRGPLLTGAAAAAGTALLVLRTPHEAGTYGFCPLLLFAGVACPLCGGLRGTYELARLDLAGAWAMNPLWVLLAPLVVALWAVWTYRRARGLPGPYLPRWTAWATLATLVAFGVLRNLPPLVPYLTPWL